MSEQVARELEQTKQELAKVRASRDALIQQSLGVGMTSTTEPRPRRRWLWFVIVSVILLGVTGWSLMRANQAISRAARQRVVVSKTTRAPTKKAENVTMLRPRRLASIPVPQLAWVTRVALSPDGLQVAVAGKANKDGEPNLLLIDLRNDQVVRRLSGHQGIVGDLVFVDRSRLVTGGSDGAVLLWSVKSGKVTKTLRKAGAAVRDVAAAGAIVAVADDAAEIKLFDLRQGGQAVLKGHASSVRAVALSPGGKLLASAGTDQVIRLWDTQSRKQVGTLEGHKQWINALAFSFDGKQLASAGFDKRIRVWDVAQRQQLHRLWGHVRRVAGLAFSRPGGMLASAGLDRRIVVWNPHTGKHLFTLKGHERQVTSVAFEPRSRYLLSGGGDGMVRIWPIPPPTTPTAVALGPPGPGELTLRSNTSGERVRVRVVDGKGKVLEQGRQQLAHIMRSGPDDSTLAPSVELTALLYKVMKHLGRQREVLLISGYRSPTFNKLRTKQSRQVGEKSLHMKGTAIDFRVDGVAITRLHKHVKSLKAGGVGFYPDSKFIHMDVGPVRYWEGN